MRTVARCLFILAAISSGACSENAAQDLREWQPEDHQVPGTGASDSRAAPSETVDPQEAEARAAAGIYASLCAGCHGPSGRGDGTAAPPVAPSMNLLDPEVQARSDEQLAQAIKEGKGGFMPAFGERITDLGIAALVRHIRRLAGNEPATPEEAAGNEPATPEEAEPAQEAETGEEAESDEATVESEPGDGSD